MMISCHEMTILMYGGPTLHQQVKEKSPSDLIRTGGDSLYTREYMFSCRYVFTFICLHVYNIVLSNILIIGYLSVTLYRSMSPQF